MAKKDLWDKIKIISYIIIGILSIFALKYTFSFNTGNSIQNFNNSLDENIQCVANNCNQNIYINETKDSHKSTAIKINGGNNIYLENNKIEGFDIGIEATNTTNLQSVNNTIS